MKAPSFIGLRPASESASKSKRNNRKTRTKHELLLFKELKRLRLSFRTNPSNLPGKPDFVFRSAKVVVFCDGDFWHGRNWRSLRHKLSNGSNPTYWIAKIRSNIRRDLRQTELLKAQGWLVIRVWETDITCDPAAIAELINKVVHFRRSALQKQRTLESNR